MSGTLESIRTHSKSESLNRDIPERGMCNTLKIRKWDVATANTEAALL